MTNLPSYAPSTLSNQRKHDDTVEQGSTSDKGGSPAQNEHLIHPPKGINRNARFARDGNVTSNPSRNFAIKRTNNEVVGST